MPWRVNPTTGERVWVADGDTATVGATNPTEGQPGFGVAPAPLAPFQPQPLEPNIDLSEGDRRLDSILGSLMNLTPQVARANAGIGLRNFGTQTENWLNEPTPEAQARQATTAAPQTPVSTPSIDLGSGYLPADQELLDQLDQISTSIGTAGAPITAPQLPQPSAAMYEVDGGHQALADHATRRRGQVDDLIAEMRGEQGDRRRLSDNKWYILGRWLSDWSATDDPTQAGAAMARVLGQNEDMRRELREETLALTQMGWSAEDAVVQAQASLLSGETQARRELAMASYDRDTRQEQVEFQTDLANQQNQTNSGRESRELMVTRAQIAHEAANRARVEREQVAGVLAQNPEYTSSAFDAMAANLTENPETQAAISQTYGQRQQYTALMGYIAANQGSNDRQVLRFLQQWDPTLRANQLERLSPEALLWRLTQAPNAEAAFAQNRNRLIQSSQFGTAPSP